MRAANCYAYLQYIGKHREYGDTIRVSQSLKEPCVPVTEELFSRGYFAFYPVITALNQGLVEVVAHVPAPRPPERLRRAGVRSNGDVKTWIVEDGAQEIVKARLSDEELNLPIAAIWNHEMLVQRVREGWSPSREGGAA